MRTRSRNPFTSVTTAGLLLPVDLLTRVHEGDPDLKGLSPGDYHLRSGERLNEAAARAWNECLAAWKSFRKKFNALPASDAGTTLTRDEWLLPLFQELGYGRLQAKKAIDIDGKEYPISHGWENHVPIHLLSARLPLDRRTPGVSGAATRAPYSLLQELLNRSAQHRWGFVTNGLKLFLLRDNAALARAANVEFDLEAMMDGEHYADFMLMFLLCHQSRVEILTAPGSSEKGVASKGKADANRQSQPTKPEDCWLEKWANQADQQGTRAREKLRDGVETAIKSLGAGFLKANREWRVANRESIPHSPITIRQKLSTGQLSTQDYYRQLLRLVYRLLLLLVAEEKKTGNGDNLLHPPGTSPEVRERYARFYSVSRIRSLAYERRGTAHTDLYESLKVLFLKLREGYAPLGIPGMGSFLFSDDSTPDLDDALLANQDLLDAFRNLCYTEDTSGRGGSYRRPVDFGNLGSEELGSVYESLLELHPNIDTDDGPFTLGTAAGNERKTTGSYYTPTSLINCLLDSALDPVVSEAIREAERMGNSEWRMVETKYKEEFAKYAYRRLPGFAGLATWKRDSESDLPVDQNVSEGRTVRDDIANAASSDVDSGKHRGGLGKTLPGGVHPVSADSQRQPDGTGNTPDHQHRRGTVQRSGSEADSGRTDDSGKTTGESGTQPEEEAGVSGELRMANGGEKRSPLAIPYSPFTGTEWDKKLASAWTTTPLTIRHSLFAEQALLDLKICDPACGSGHFLIAASERLAHHLARLRTGDDQPSTLDVQHAKRDIIGRCIYGVDINPMAVELCKVSLWMEALEPGKPLSFLDHHIQCGNSLLGTTPRLLAEGIPDDAFKPIEGDDKAVCKELKADNKKQRKEYEAGYRDLHPLINLGDLPQHFAALTRQISETVADTAAKAARYTELVKHSSYETARLLADCWCAAFVWKKDASDLGKLCPTERDYRRLQAAPSSILPHVKSEVRRLADQYQLFHWQLAFPDVFALPGSDVGPENKQTGWDGGFNLVLGNPPWERIKLQEKEWFAERSPAIANASNAAARKRMIEALKSDEPTLHAAFRSDLRKAEAESGLARNSGRFPLCGRGDVNTYSLFAELNRSLIGQRGRVGCIVPSGIATDDTTKFFFRDLVNSKSLVSLYDIENRNQIFQGVHRSFRFSLLTLASPHGGPLQATFAFFLGSPAELQEAGRSFTLGADDLALMNPNTRTCPIFPARQDAEIAKYIYRRNAVLVREGEQELNTWGIKFATMFHMANDSHLFRSGAGLEHDGFSLSGNLFHRGNEEFVPLYEAKMTNPYDHRHGSVVGSENLSEMSGIAAQGTTLAEHQDPEFVALPRYWVHRAEVDAAITRIGFPHRFLINFRDVARATDARTAIQAVLPLTAVGHKAPLILPMSASAHEACAFLGALNSFPYDYCVRQKFGSASLSYFVIKQTPCPPPEAFRESRCEFSVAWFATRVIELTFTAWDLEAFALDCGYDGPPFRWDEERRFQMRCELDAAYFHLYLGANSEWGMANGGEGEADDHSPFATHHSPGREANSEWGMANGGEGVAEDHSPFATHHSPTADAPQHAGSTTNSQLLEMFPTPRDAVSYIMDTFPIVRRKDEAKYDGDYRTKRVILEIYDQMAEVMRANREWRMANREGESEDHSPFATYHSPFATYHSPLDPPPGPPTDAAGNFIPMSEWDPAHWPSHIHAPRDPAASTEG